MFFWRILALLLLCTSPLPVRQYGPDSPVERQTPDERLEEVRKLAIRLNSDDPLRTEDSELNELTKYLNGVEIIQLGEQTHGDGSFFLHRTRLVRFLYRFLDFDVIAFESGMFECQQVDYELGRTTDMAEALAPGVYPVWRLSSEMQPFFNLIRQSKNSARPISFRGFDCQFSSDTSAKRIFDAFGQVATITDRKLISSTDKELLLDLLDTIEKVGATKIDPPRHQSYTEMLDRLDHLLDRPSIRASKSRLTRERWHRVIDNLRAMERNLYFKSQGPSFQGNFDEILQSPEIILAGNVRDAAMSKNLQWLSKVEFPARRMIVWAANNHVKYQGSVVANKRLEDGSIPREVRAGELLRQHFNDRVYTILAVSFEGTWAAPSIKRANGFHWQTGVVRPASKGTFAHLCKSAGLGAFILDVRGLRDNDGHWINSPMIIHPDMFEGKPKRLSDVCDAILFVDQLKPSGPIK